jgi:hypothetical protein
LKIKALGRLRAAVSSILVMVLLSGCVAPAYYASKDLKQSDEPLTILLLNPDVTLYIQTAGSVLEAQDQWTKNAVGHIKKHLKDVFKTSNLNLVLANDFDQVVTSDEQELELLKLHQVVGDTIQLHHYTPIFALPSKAKNSVWSLGPGVSYLQEKYDADYVLFVRVQDSYASAERVAAIIIVAVLFGASLPAGQQTGFTSLVDLETGDVVWFNRLLRGHGDLREEEPARESVDALLLHFPGLDSSQKPSG